MFETSADKGLTSRQRDILAIVAEQGFATIDALARQFDVSAQTVRRDIIHLDRARLLQRFHGGAGLRESTVRMPYDTKKQASPRAKEAIGEAFAALVPDGASLFLDVGTTVEAVARALTARRGLRVFTTSMACAMAFAGHPTSEAFVTGGIVGGPDGSLVGPAALEAIGRFRVDWAVIGCSGFDEDGAAMDFDTQKVAGKRAMMANARRSALVADASKFARAAIVRVGPLAAFDLLVSDAAPPGVLAELTGPDGTELVLAGA